MTHRSRGGFGVPRATRYRRTASEILRWHPRRVAERVLAMRRVYLACHLGRT